MTDAPQYGIITTTVGSKEDARGLADALLAEKLAACVQLMDIESHYSWKGERKSEPEVMLIAKTRTDLFTQAMARIEALHPYETPEIVAQTFAAGFPPYLRWIALETGG